MMEHIVQMGPMLVLAGLMAAWLAEAVSHAGGYGFISDALLGLAGSVASGGLFWTGVYGDVGMIAMFLIGSAGAGLAIADQRTLWGSAEVRP